MMKRSMMLLAMMLLTCPLSFATPPGDLTLSYDLDAGMLPVQGPHPTQDRFKHYIRRMVVKQNQQEPQTFYFTRQDSASEFKQTVPLKMKAADKIHIQVYCSQGGSKEADLVIPEEKKEEGMKALDLKALKDQDHKNSQVIP